MNSILKLFSILTIEQKKQCAFIIFIMIIGALLEAFGIGLILPLLTVIGDENIFVKYPVIKKYTDIFHITSHTVLIVAVSFCLIIVFFIKNVYITWQLKQQINFSLKNQIYYSSMLMQEYLNKPYFFHLNNNTANILRNVNASGQIIFSNMYVSAFQLLTEIVTAFMIWIMLAYIDPFTAIVAAGFLILMLYIIIKAFRKKITEQGKIQNLYSAQYLKWVNQGLGAIKETKVLRKEKFFLESFTESYNKYGDAYRVFLFLSQLPRTIIETTVVTGLLLLIIIKILLGTSPAEIVGVLGVLALAAFRLMPSANRIVNLSNNIKFNMPFFNQLYDELIAIKNNGNEKTDHVFSDSNEKLEFNNKLCIENLSFSYNENTLVLKNINFIVPKGKFVGLVGPSGAGKTTFVDILLGLLQPSGGKITADGINIFKNIRSWQANLAYVPQSIYLIDGTIKENIALGVNAKDTDDELIDKVLHMAELYDFVYGLPDGINTNVGERGVKLSGGQRQRIGIARALYNKPEVLILDEATSALDSETEKNITDTILKLKGQMTIIAIAHRLSTLEQCDFKIKFENGCSMVEY